jgi:hypothetical protein
MLTNISSMERPEVIAKVDHGFLITFEIAFQQQLRGTLFVNSIELKQTLDDIISKLDELLEILTSSSAVKENFL